MKTFISLFFVVCSSIYGTWAEDTLQTLTREEKVGQLFVISICPPRGEKHLQHLKKFLKKYPVGGVLFKQACPVEQVAFLDAVQAFSPIPLLTLADAEWGLGMRMKQTLSYPRNLTLGAVQNHQLLKEMGCQIGQQCRLVGVHVNLAPVVDANTNPNNPVIHRRALGDDPKEIGIRATALLQGMQEEGLLACAKHFPGHGDTAVDSHHDLPIVTHNSERLNSVELFPFKEVIASGVKCILTAHLLVPALDRIPCTFSRFLVTDLLQDQMGFRGLIITDALNMKALTNYYSTAEIGLRAFLAGHHFLLYGSHRNEVVDEILDKLVPEAFDALVQSDVPDEILNARVLKILQTKEAMGLHNGVSRLERDDLVELLHEPNYLHLIARLFEEALTIYRQDEFPKPQEKIAYIQIGKEEATSFFSDLQEIFNVTFFQHGTDFSLEGFDRIILALYKKEMPEDLRDLHATTIVFTTPYALPTCPKSGTIVVAYEETRDAERAVVRMMRGDLQAKGRLPVHLPFE